MSDKKTSFSHPLRIDSIEVPGTKGTIGMTFCPGKKGKGLYSGEWDRDLEADFKVIKEWGAEAIISLMEEKEFLMMHMPEFFSVVPMYGLIEYHLPIVDGQIPGEIFENKWRNVGAKIRQFLRNGKKVVVHCKGGLGRTGTIAARLLVELGMNPEEAIMKVRECRPGAIETDAQLEYVLMCRPVRDKRDFEHFAGCLLGGAVGDALGAPVEFLSIHQIKERYGRQGITDYDECYGRKGAITDDTQMTLFTAEGILRAECRVFYRGIGPAYRPVVYHAYQRWLHTQGENSPDKFFGRNDDGWLIGVPGLHHRRAPGSTCISALKQGNWDTEKSPLNNSKGCGGVMRVAPVGLHVEAQMPFPDRGMSSYDIFDFGCDMASITHFHPSGYLPAGCLAIMISEIISGNSLKNSTNNAIEVLKERPDNEETLNALRLAIRLAEDSKINPGPETIKQIGEGWVAEEALAIACYCSLVAENDFARGVRLAVNHDGDSDSTGAISGNILGALLGKSAIPSGWLEELEMRDVIEEVAQDLLVTFEEGPAWLKKYPEW